MRNYTTLLPLAHCPLGHICQLPMVEARRGGCHCPVRMQMNLINERHVAKTEMNRASIRKRGCGGKIYICDRTGKSSSHMYLIDLWHFTVLRRKLSLHCLQ